MRRCLAIALCLAGAAGPALAHARLVRAEPRVGATERASPTELRLLFSESIVPIGSQVRVNGPAGPAPVGPLAIDPGDRRWVRVPLRAALPPGTYRVEWGMTSADTHHTEGDFTFKVAQ